MNEKKDKKSQKPEHVSKNWKSSQGIRLLAMVLAIVSGFFVAVTKLPGVDDYYTSLDEITVPTTVSGWLCLTGLQCSMM